MGNKGIAAQPGDRAIVIGASMAEIEPPIMRTLRVLDAMSLVELHYTLQIVFGWDNEHLHEFSISETTYRQPVHQDRLLRTCALENEQGVLLRDVLPAVGFQFEYRYDYGDNWRVNLRVLGMGEPLPGERFPVCLKGERSGPPEDSGGILRYARMIEILNQPDHPGYPDIRTWLGHNFDPERFDLEAVNDSLGGVTNWAAMEEIDLLAAVTPLPPEYAEPPFNRLMTLGYTERTAPAADLGIGPEHVPMLIHILRDKRLLEEWDDPRSSAQVHAWRLLGELQPPEAPAVLLELLEEADTADDAAIEEIPVILARFGEPVIPLIERFLVRPDAGIFDRVSAAGTLRKIAQEWPEYRDRCVGIIAERLSDRTSPSADLNGYLVLYLCELKATESAPVIEQAFADGVVDHAVMGDWEDAQIDLGLLDKRLTPRRSLLRTGPRGKKRWSLGPRTTPSAKQSKKKSQKQARRTGRKNKKK